MIKDRGNIKWTAMMIPEHVELVKEAFKKADIVTKPELDDQEQEEINQSICEAMESNREVTVTYFQRGKMKFEMGYIHYADVLNKEIRMKDKFDSVHRLKFENIIKVQIN